MEKSPRKYKAFVLEMEKMQSWHRDLKTGLAIKKAEQFSQWSLRSLKAIFN